MKIILKKLCILSFCLLICQYISGNDAVNTKNDSLKLHLMFDAKDGLKVKDCSVSGNDGIIQGEHHCHNKSFGNGLEFDGESGGIILTKPVELGDSNQSVEILFAANTTTKDMMLWGNLVAGGKANTSGCEIGLARTTLTLTWTKKTDGYIKIPIGEITPGKIYSAAVTYNKDENKIAVYLNGILKSTKQVDGYKNNAFKESIAFNSASKCWYFAGIVYEVKVYNRVLTSNEISKEYESSLMKKQFQNGEQPIQVPPQQTRCKTILNLEKGIPQRIITYGTSLTKDCAWVEQLRKVLNSRYGTLVTIINSAKGATTSSWGITNLEERVLREKPDCVFLEFAVNDAYVPAKKSEELSRSNLNNMIDRILEINPNCEIILMTMNPSIGKNGEARPKLEKYYQIYRDTAKSRNLILIDHYPNWQKLLMEDPKTFNKYVPDGLHPGAIGCEKIILPSILKTLGIE